ncbi:unnamed protein product, partial [Bubo scandiacus]
KLLAFIMLTASDYPVIPSAVNYMASEVLQVVLKVWHKNRLYGKIQIELVQVWWCRQISLASSPYSAWLSIRGYLQTSRMWTWKNGPRCCVVSTVSILLRGLTHQKLKRLMWTTLTKMLFSTLITCHSVSIQCVL